METIKKHYQFTNFSHNEIIAELEKQRIKKNLSKKDFSKLAGYARCTYSNYCLSEKGFSRKSFRAFANKYAPHLLNEKTLFSKINSSQAPQPKSKQIVTTDPETGKLKVERNGSSTQLDLNIDHSITEPEPFDIREVIAEYIRKFGTELTAIELIGHLTIDAKWQSTEK